MKKKKLEEGVAHDRPPDPDPHEVPGEEVPVEEAGRPPDPPGGGIGMFLFMTMTTRRRSNSKARAHQRRKQRLVPSKPRQTLSHTCAHIVIGARIVIMYSSEDEAPHKARSIPKRVESVG